MHNHCTLPFLKANNLYSRVRSVFRSLCLIVAVLLSINFDHNSGALVNSAYAAPSPQEECQTTSFDWADLSVLNEEDGTFPFVTTIAEIAGTTIDMTVTIERDGQDDNHVNVPGSTDFPGILDAYNDGPEVFRFWRQDDAEVDTIYFDFSEPIRAHTLMFGGQRPDNEGEFAYLEITFWDGPNGTGNKVISQHASGPNSITEINTGDPTVTAINVLQDQGPQRAVFSDDTYAGIGLAEKDRPWTVLEMGGAEFRSLTWAFYGSAVDTDDLAEARANIVDAGNMSAYLSSFSFAPPEFPECGGPLGSIGDTVWLDANADGIQDVDEEGIADVTLELCDIDGTVVSTMTTDLDGMYLFDELELGEYTVKVVTSTLPSGVLQTFDASDELNHRSTTTIDADTPDDLDQDFGYVPSGSIGNKVWLDTNADGIQDADEDGIADVSLELCDIDGTVVSTMTTDLDGMYLFDELILGEYTVKVVTSTLPAGVLQTFDASDELNHRSSTTIDADTPDDLDQDFGYVPGASIGNKVWIDANVNGIQDTGEEGVPDILVELYDLSQTLVTTMTTDAEGCYEFTGLATGEYYVHIDIPDGYVITLQDAGTADAVDSDIDSETQLTPMTMLDVSERDLTWDAGVIPTACVGNWVWLDDNRNGYKDIRESGIVDVTVTLYDDSGTEVAEMQTDAEGFYAFCELMPGDYSLGFEVPPAMEFTDQSVLRTTGFNSDANVDTGRTRTIALEAGEYDPSWGAGFVKAVPLSLNVMDEPAVFVAELYIPFISQ